MVSLPSYRAQTERELRKGQASGACRTKQCAAQIASVNGRDIALRCPQMPLRLGAPQRGAPTHLLHNQHEQQLPATYLRTFDHKRAALAQLCVHLEQKLLFLEKLQVQN